MIGGNAQPQARALLFERLVDLDPRSPTEPLPLRALNQQALRESVRCEVGRLLNTRCSTLTHRLPAGERTVLDYGVPDFSALSPQSPADRRRLAQIVSQAIAAFEPRLQQVSVTVECFVDQQKALLVRINARLVVDTVSEPVSFPILIQNKSGEVNVHEREYAG